MQQVVKIRVEGNKIKLNFIYNTDLIDIMHSYDGYFFRKEKAWVFSKHKLEEIKSELIKKMYDVRLVKVPEQKTKQTILPTTNAFKDPET